jgi:signal transduction histidine kinase
VSASYDACLALGGRVSVSTLAGRGTTFRFHIPSGGETEQRDATSAA